MARECLAFSPEGICSVLKPDPAPRPTNVAIGASVGVGGRNVGSDARTIQAALNRVPPSRGGPVLPLTVDGIVGPLTVAAIRRFQQPHIGFNDGRVDPTGRTLGALNGEIHAATTAGVKSFAAAPRSDFQPPDPEVMAMVLRLIVGVREVTRAANFRLAAAERFISNRSAPQGPFAESARTSFEMLEAAFSLSKVTNRLAAFGNIRRVFRNMDVALNRTFETNPLIAPVLFTPNTHLQMEDKAAGYTTHGGAFLTSKDRLEHIDEPADRIYVCRNLLKLPEDGQIASLVHELAHFVSGQPIEIVDKARGHMLRLAERGRFNALQPDIKIRSAENYAFFGMISRTPRFMTQGI